MFDYLLSLQIIWFCSAIRDLPISGWPDPGENVLNAFHGEKVAAQADQDGRWSASLGPFPAGARGLAYRVRPDGPKSVGGKDSTDPEKR